MILKEFDVVDDKNMENKNKFGLQTRCTTNLFETFFPKFKTNGIWKIQVECTGNLETEKIHPGLWVYEVQVHYSVEEFFLLSNFEKKVKTLELLKQGIDFVIIDSGWDPNPFEEAFQKVIENNYQNHAYWLKPKASPNRQYIGHVYGEFEIDSFDLYLIITNKQGEEVRREKAFSDLPDDFIFPNKIGSTKWISKTEFCLFNQEGDEVKIVRI